MLGDSKRKALVQPSPVVLAGKAASPEGDAIRKVTAISCKPTRELASNTSVPMAMMMLVLVQQNRSITTSVLIDRFKVIIEGL